MSFLHKFQVALIASACLIGLNFSAPEALAQKTQPLSVEDLFSMSRISQLAVSPNGHFAAFVSKKYDMDDNSGKSSIWLASLKSRKYQKLTNSSSSDWAPRWISSTRLAFLSTRSGSPQIWSIPIQGGEATQLTRLAVPVGNFTIAPGGKYAAIHADVFPECTTMACNLEKADQKAASKVTARIYDSLLYRIWDTWRDEKLGHILWVSLDGGEEARDLTPGKWQTPPLDLGGYMDLDISPDGKEVAFTANATDNPAWNTNNDIFVVPVNGGEPKNISVRNKACDADPIFSPNGKFIAYVAMKRAGFEADRRVLTIYNRRTRKILPLTEDLDRSVGQFSWAHDSKEIIFNAWDRGHLAIFKVSVPSGLTTKLVGEHTNTNPQYFDQGTRVAFLRQTMSSPPELFTTSNTGKKTSQLTRANDDYLKKIQMGEYEEFEYTGAGGDKIHGFLLLPPGFNHKKKYPLLMLIHGGPQGAFGDSFHPRWNMQMFATPGFVVAAVNFHGSSGYGQKFTDAVSGDWGGKPYEDIMLGVDHVGDTYSFVDKNNVSAAGASYGGFMINWILGHTDRFKSLVSHDGVYDQVSMYGSTEELWFPEWEFNGTPWTNPDLYKKFSPSTYVDQFKTPTLVIHGEHDYRVPYTQGLQLFTALQRQGVESKLLFYPDETHFVQKPQNARLWWNTVLTWLADHAGIKWTPPGLKAKQPPAKKTIKRIAG
ncbi:MAG: S9 family peptidase [Deltaproteobacteria bacterium]|nr:S9 family peptidase [Deltaproteobacteria bacterium]